MNRWVLASKATLTTAAAAMTLACGSDEIVGEEENACRALPARAAAPLLEHTETELDTEEDSAERCAYSTERGDLLAFDFFSGTSLEQLLPQLGWGDAQDVEQLGERAVGRGSVTGDRYGQAQLMTERAELLLVVTVRVWEPRDPLPIAIEAARMILDHE